MSMNNMEQMQLQAWNPAQGGGPVQGPFQGAPFQGFGGGLGGPSQPIFSPVQVMPPAQQVAAPAAGGGGKGLAGMLNPEQIKGFIDRMGGIEGLVSNIGKFQKIMSTVQQVAPLLKLFTGKGKGGSTGDTSSGSYRRRRRGRRGRRTNGGARRQAGRNGPRTGSGSGRRRASGKRRR
ncbi:aminotransferase [Cohnella zeiphila]|uniref:aminotransferase n=1 Tax=Cohnella zeiphila TaxID=2761120 RepID=UPI001EE1DE9F|nr:aminotransferase [Cohnella zeiphila]